MALGRITGPLLKANLLRQGVNLAFETDLLYIDVVNGRIGVKTTTPSNELQVNGTTRTTNLEVSTQADIASFTISSNTIASTNSTINLTPSGTNPVVYQGKMRTGNLQLSTNLIETLGANTDLVIQTTGTGEVNVNANMLVNGDLHATGTITADGDITIGDSNTDNIVFNADINSNIIPDDNNTWDLGSGPIGTGQSWRTVYSNNVVSNTLTATSIIGNGIELTLPQGNIWYVAENGNDTYDGNHEHAPFATIKHALSQAAAGDEVFVFPGTYTEIFPLTMPVGVTLRGAGIRAVKIQPTVGTFDKDAILLNGQTTIEDLSITGFKYNAINDTGYAFRFVSGMVTASRSPYIRNITVITTGSVTSPSDPYGYDSGDAGQGAFLDGSVVSSTSIEVACLFHSVTFIVPAQSAVKATNGTRIEWLNSFSYFANKGIHLISGSVGKSGAGKTILRIDNRTGTWNVGNTVTYYDTDGTTVLGSGTISSIDGNYVSLAGKCIGFETLADRLGKPIAVAGNAKLSTAEKKFGISSLYLDGTGDFISATSQPDFAFGQANRTPKTIVVNGNTTVSSTRSKFGGASILFDGTGDYLQITDATDFDFSNYTIEGWIYLESLPVGAYSMIFSTTGVNCYWGLRNVGGTLYLTSYDGTTINEQTTGTTVQLNQWTHVAWSRTGTVIRSFVNGQLVHTGASSATIDATGAVVGYATAYVNQYQFNGYLDELRVSNSARYLSTFTPSNAAFTHDSNSVLLLHGDIGIIDDAGDQTAGDFTIEGYIFPTTTGTYRLLFDMRTAATDVALTLALDSSNSLYCYINGSIVIQGTTPLPLNFWWHVSLVRSSGSLRMFFNGVQQGSTYNDLNNYVARPLRIGADYSSAYGFTGYIDDVRITKGIARYMSAYVPPTSALTGDTATVLLLHFNGLNNSTTILDDGVTLQDVRTNAGGTSTRIDFANYQDFGAEFRSIGSACIYGVYGAYGDGDGCLAYLISQNFAYVGSGKSLANDPNERVEANEVVKLNRAKIYYTSVDNEGNFKVGDSFYVNQKTGDVLFSGENLNITTLAGITFSDGIHTTTITPSEVTTGNITITGNTIQSNFGDINVVSNSGEINLQNNTYVTGDLTVTGNTLINGNTVLGNTSGDTMNFVASIGSSLVPSINNFYNLGSASPNLRWKDVYVNNANLNGINISTNTIQGTATDTDLVLTANGTGRVYFPDNNVQVDQNLTVTNDFTVTTGTSYLKNTTIVGTVTQTGDINQTGNFTTSGNTSVTGNITGTGYLQLPVIRIENNTISTTTTDTDLEFQANGTGNIIFEGIQVSDNNISSTVTNSDIVLTPQGTGIVNINSNQSFKIPVGTTAERPSSPAVGMIRYNTSLSQYEGWTGSYWQSLGGVIDIAGATKITPELAPGTADNIIRFYINNVVKATLDSTKLETSRIQTDNIDIQQDTITTTVSGTDLNLLTTGAGGVRVGNLRFRNNTITNVTSGGITEFIQTAGGYVRIAGTGGVVIPAGDSLNDRPGITELGMIRFNTVLGLVEVYNGVTWTSVAGQSGGVTSAEATDIGIVTALLFG